MATGLPDDPFTPSSWNPYSGTTTGTTTGPCPTNAPKTITATRAILGAGGAFLAGSATVLSVYHGYKRNRGSVGWTFAWGVFGTFAPLLAVPIAFAQGLGEKKY